MSFGRKLAVYVHWPFCKRICPYCDFNKYLDKNVDHTRMSNALNKELQTFLRWAQFGESDADRVQWQQRREKLGNRNFIRNVESGQLLRSNRSNGPSYTEVSPSAVSRVKSSADGQGESVVPVVTSVYFGGGTPSLARATTLRSVLDQLEHLQANDCEISLEVNPSATGIGSLQAFKDIGINRVSLGIQSFDDAALKFLGRDHSSEQAQNAVKRSLELFPRVTLDLIYGRPGQSIEQWRRELREALSLGCGHVSLYQLTIEKGTPFHRMQESGQLAMPSNEDTAAMYGVAVEECDRFGLKQYEVSNFSRGGEQSRHNMHYWTGGDYIGIGPGAHSRLTLPGSPRVSEGPFTCRPRVARVQGRSPDEWMTQVESDGHDTRQRRLLGCTEQVTELLMTSLRTANGLSRTLLNDVCMAPLEEVISVVDAERLNEFVIIDDDGIRMTRAGLAVLDSVLPRLLKGGVLE